MNEKYTIIQGMLHRRIEDTWVSMNFEELSLMAQQQILEIEKYKKRNAHQYDIISDFEYWLNRYDPDKAIQCMNAVAGHEVNHQPDISFRAALEQLLDEYPVDQIIQGMQDQQRGK